MLMRQYEQDRKEIVEAGNLGHESIFSDYKIITNDSHLFTLRIDTTISQGGSINISKFYHIDKENDKIITLPDLFIVDSNYVEVLSSYIKAEMRQKMANDEGVSYFIDSEEGFTEWDFHQIKEDQNFYKNDKGNLVLVFDEYEVAPGYMGIVEFEIPYDIVKDIFISSL